MIEKRLKSDAIILQIIKDLDVDFRKNDYNGWDLYDALLSKLFRKGSVLDSRYPRYIWTQVNKRFPINLRRLMLVPKSHNPKGLALILRAYCEWYRLTGEQQYLDQARQVARFLLQSRSKAINYCWGNNFPYQSRGDYYDAYCPNGITTSFAINAIIDLYLISRDSELLPVIESVRAYIIDELLLHNKDGMAVFKYYEQDDYITYNATAKITESLAKIYSVTKDEALPEIIQNSYRFILSKQNPDGSWYYDESKTGKWIDNFHTGYVLVALLNIKRILGLEFGEAEIAKGLAYHMEYQYTPDKVPKYYTNSLYPIDTHCFAQSIITFSEFGKLDFAAEICKQAIRLMYDREGKYFIYSIRKHYRVRTNLLRWCNAYMFFALALYLRKRYPADPVMGERSESI
ncbi:exopolysaccharide biosynthesis protein VpsJ [Candidatus Cloacimonadaceae bacterium]